MGSRSPLRRVILIGWMEAGEISSSASPFWLQWVMCHVIYNFSGIKAIAPYVQYTTYPTMTPRSPQHTTVD